MRAEQATEPRDDSAEDGPGGFRIRPDSGEHVPRGATQMALGAGLGIDDFDAVATLGETCDRLGLDVISAGNAVAWAVRATEAGFLDRALSFGDGDAARALIEAIAERDDDLASTLADGVAAAGDRFGGADLVPTIKAAELPPYDPRGALGMALAYATSDRGACHRRARPVEREAFESESWTDADRVDAVRTSQLERSVLWSLGADDFATAVLRADLGAEWLAAVGLDYTRGELQAIGERIWTLTRLFNVRAGFDRTDDTLPDALQEPHADAGRADHDADAGMDGIDPGRFERLRSRYYAACGWSERGLPANPLLERIGLQDVVDADTPVADAPLTFDDADDSS